MTSLRITTFVVALTACLCSKSQANNTYFLPGDAFFYLRLDEVEVAKLPQVKSPEFLYGNHWDGGYFCGYIGFKKLKILNMSQNMTKGLVKAFARFKSQLNPDGLSDKRISVFVYNKDYDWKKHGIGLQYNEKWTAETLRFCYNPDHAKVTVHEIRVCSFPVLNNFIVFRRYGEGAT